MRIVPVIFYLCTAFDVAVRGQSMLLISGADAVARGGAVCADTAGVWSAAINPAAAAGATTLRASPGVSIPTIADEPTGKFFLLTAPVAPFALIGVIESYGVSQFHETQISLGAAAQFFSRISFGARMNLHSVEIERYGAANAITCDAGVRFELVPQFAIAASSTNIFAAKIGAMKIILPRELRIGVAMAPHPSVLVTVDAINRTDDRAALAFGTRVEANKYLFLSVGSTSDATSFTAGMEIHSAPIEFSYAYAARPAIGAMQTISIAISVNPKSKDQQ